MPVGPTRMPPATFTTTAPDEPEDGIASEAGAAVAGAAVGMGAVVGVLAAEPQAAASTDTRARPASAAGNRKACIERSPLAISDRRRAVISATCRLQRSIRRPGWTGSRALTGAFADE